MGNKPVALQGGNQRLNFIGVSEAYAMMIKGKGATKPLPF